MSSEFVSQHTQEQEFTATSVIPINSPRAKTVNGAYKVTYKLSSISIAIALSLASQSIYAGSDVEYINFDNNSIPSDWSIWQHVSPGKNIGIRNNRFDAGQVDSTGGISRPFYGAGVQSVTVEYDANISNVYWGQGSASTLTQSMTNVFSTYLQSGGGKTGFGEGTMRFDIAGAQAGISQSYFSTRQPLAVGDYHFSTTYQDGRVSQNIVSQADNKTISSQVVAVPSLKLASMNNLIVFSGTTTGASAWFDNVKVSTAYENNPHTAYWKDYFRSTKAGVDSFVEVLGYAQTLYCAIKCDLPEKIAELVKLSAQNILLLNYNPRALAALQAGESLGDVKSFLEAIKGIDDPVSLTGTMGSITMKMVSKGLDALANDPPRDDFLINSRVADSFNPLTYLPQYESTALTSAYIEMTASAVDALDGINVALLSAERAWGASASGNEDAVVSQAQSYSTGAKKVNDALRRFQASFADLTLALRHSGISDDLSTLPSQPSSDEINEARILLKSTGQFTDTEIDSALALILGNQQSARAGGLYAEMEKLSDVVSKNLLPEHLQNITAVPEPESFVLLVVGLVLLLLWKRRIVQ